MIVILGTALNAVLSSLRRLNIMAFRNRLVPVPAKKIWLLVVSGRFSLVTQWVKLTVLLRTRFRVPVGIRAKMKSIGRLSLRNWCMNLVRRLLNWWLS